MNRFFRTADGQAYEQIRLTLDAAWGHPTADGKTITCISPLASATKDFQGRVLLSVRAEFCDFSVAADLLPQVLASGAVEEITEAEYQVGCSIPPE